MIIVLTPESFYDASPYLPSETVLGQPFILSDGRCAVCHPFSDDDVAFLMEFGGEVVDVLPEVKHDTNSD